MFILIFTFYFALVNSPILHAVIKDPAYDEFEGLALVEALIRDSKFAVAESELKKLSGRTDRHLKAAGQIKMGFGNAREALDLFMDMSESPEKHFLTARAQAGLKNWPDCAQSFLLSADFWLKGEADAILRSQCERHSNRPDSALNTISTALARYPTPPVRHEYVSLLIEMNLVRTAMDFIFKSDHSISTSEGLALAELFHNKKLKKETLLLVEWSRLKKPFDPEVNLTLGKLYYDQAFSAATTEAFERAARVDSQYSLHATEMSRQLGRHEIAQVWMPLIPGERDQIRSRLALYVEKNRYPLIASMESLVSRSEIRKDDEVRYALGYSLFLLGERNKPLRYLSQITSPGQAKKAALLKNEIQKSAP